MSPRNQKLSATICLTPLLLVAADAARADMIINTNPEVPATNYGPGAGFAFPDNNPAGGSSTILAINVANPTISSFDSVVIDVSVAHTWLGDLTATLTAPDGITNVQLFRRPGTTALGSTGDWLIGTYTFVLSGGVAFPQAGNTVPGSSYNITSNPGSAQQVPLPDPDTYSVFTGMNLNGTWTLNISDNATGDTGSISGWSMNITSVPEPSTFALLGMMAAGALGVRTWRKRKAA